SPMGASGHAPRSAACRWRVFAAQNAGSDTRAARLGLDAGSATPREGRSSLLRRRSAPDKLSRLLFTRHVNQARSVILAKSFGNKGVDLLGGHRAIPIHFLVQQVRVTEVGREHRQFV